MHSPIFGYQDRVFGSNKCPSLQFKTLFLECWVFFFLDILEIEWSRMLIISQDLFGQTAKKYGDVAFTTLIRILLEFLVVKSMSF